VVNVSEGRERTVLEGIADAAGADLLDLHADPDHHRAVLTLVGADAARRVASEAVRRLDLATHQGAHPRLGVVDVVPFVPLDGSTMDDALAARDAFAAWFAEAYGVPAFLYGPERSLPDVRRQAFREVSPDVGPPVPHPTAGACCVGARPVLVAYNVWLAGSTLDQAREIAASIRQPGLRALGLLVGEAVQVSMNLVDPAELGPAAAYDLVAERLRGTAGTIERAELVGLVPRAVLDAVDPARWDQLDLAAERTIDARLLG
jgi:glutamate formiminotransferase